MKCIVLNEIPKEAKEKLIENMAYHFIEHVRVNAESLSKRSLEYLNIVASADTLTVTVHFEWSGKEILKLIDPKFKREMDKDGKISRSN